MSAPHWSAKSWLRRICPAASMHPARSSFCCRTALRREIPSPLVRHQEERFLPGERNWPTKRTTELVQVEVRFRKCRHRTGRQKVGFVEFVLQRPCGQRGVLVVVEQRSVVIRLAALGLNANV